MAIKLVAEESLTDDEIAMRLRVRLGTLEELKQDPLFAKRVDDTRHGLPTQQIYSGPDQRLDRHEVHGPRLE
jgi:hypothetical protein